ncbi:MAG: polysaccharide deacetylase family protein [PVC group bacterium]|nr:polysaccharide deacetylase family protein [PVC group bacterium]
MFKKIIKSIFYLFVTATGIIFILRRLRQKILGNQIVILFTHRIVCSEDEIYPLLKMLEHFNVEEFEQRIKYLSKQYQFISLSQALGYIKSGKIPEDCIVLTFDDGYRCNYERVLPILKKYRVPATVFVTTDSINDKNILWYDQLNYAVAKTKKTELELWGNKYLLSSVGERKKVYVDMCSRLKAMDNKEKIIMLDKILSMLEVDKDKLLEKRLMLNWEEIKQMQQSGLVEIGAHSITHPILTKISSEQAKEEIVKSKQILEEKLGTEVRHFAYPNGDYNAELTHIVRDSGYESACTVNYEEQNNSTKIYALNRKGFTFEDFRVFTVKIAGITDLYKKIYKQTEKMQPWLINYAFGIIKRSKRPDVSKTKHVFLSVCDHFEPLWGAADARTGLDRMKNWREKYPRIAEKYKDADGCSPKYSFFYPEEEYRHEYMEMLTDICRKKYGEVEIHLHHNNDTADNLRKTINGFRDTLRDKYGLLSKDKQTGEIKYGFIHGNWCLDNSRPDGRWCGINNEISILQETGCYADFTMPSAPDPTQTFKINSIYYAVDNPDEPKSHNSGRDAKKGRRSCPGLLMVQGPLMLNWKNRKMGVMPRIENGSIGRGDFITPERMRLWIAANVHIKNKPEYVFIKLYTHGCQEKNMNYLLDEGLDKLYSFFQENYNDGIKYKTHYVSAREMVNIIKAVEDDCQMEDIKKLRNYRYVC